MTNSNRLCKDGWIEEYLKYTSMVESPEIFHFWTAIATIACAVGRNVYFPFGFSKLFPNLYMILVGPSGMRKTAATDIGMDMLRLALPDLDVFEGKATMPALMERMEESQKATGDSRIVLYAGEAKVLLGGAMTNSSILEDLTELYACKDKFTYQTRLKGKTNIPNVSINLIGASIPEWLVSTKGSDFISSGFSARILYIFQDVAERRFYKPTKPEGSAEMEIALLSDLQTISRLGGKKEAGANQFKITPEAESIWAEWYNDTDNFSFDDERLGPYMERKDKHMLKLAMCLALSYSDDLVIEPRHIKGAIAALNGIETGMLATYKSVSFHEAGQHQDKILALLSKSEGGFLSKRDLARKMSYKVGRAMLDEVLASLVDQERIEHYHVQKHTRKIAGYRIKIGD